MKHSPVTEAIVRDLAPFVLQTDDRVLNQYAEIYMALCIKLRDRDRIGFKTYDKPLDAGEKGIPDALEEILDAIQYLKCEILSLVDGEEKDEIEKLYWLMIYSAYRLIELTPQLSEV